MPDILVGAGVKVVSKKETVLDLLELMVCLVGEPAIKQVITQMIQLRLWSVLGTERVQIGVILCPFSGPGT